MLIISLVLAVIGLAALVFAVITSNELVAWVCIGASVLGVILLIIDALQERQRRGSGPATPTTTTTTSPRTTRLTTLRRTLIPRALPTTASATSTRPTRPRAASPTT